MQPNKPLALYTTPKVGPSFKSLVRQSFRRDLASLDTFFSQRNLFLNFSDYSAIYGRHIRYRTANFPVLPGTDRSLFNRKYYLKNRLEFLHKNSPTFLLHNRRKITCKTKPNRKFKILLRRRKMKWRVFRTAANNLFYSGLNLCRLDKGWDYKRKGILNNKVRSKLRCFSDRPAGYSNTILLRFYSARLDKVSTSRRLKSLRT